MDKENLDRNLVILMKNKQLLLYKGVFMTTVETFYEVSMFADNFSIHLFFAACSSEIGYKYLSFQLLFF